MTSGTYRHQAGKRRFVALLALLPALSACTMDVEPDYSRPHRPRPQPQMCTMEYAPVCAERGRRQRTFDNACEARNRGFFIVGHGECRSNGPVGSSPWDEQPERPQRPENDRPRPPRPDRPERPDRPDRPGRPEGQERPERPAEGGFCTREFAPVCGERGGQTQTFPNACEAGNGGFSVIAQGECRP
jgi:hypothetical protein